MKYIITKNEFGFELPIVFSEMLKHSDIPPKGTLLSAGFCQVVGGKVVAWGYSQSLGLESRKEDADIIKAMLEEQGQ